MKKLICIICLIVSAIAVSGQEQKVPLDKLSWREVVNKQPAEWYGSPEAIRIADNVLLYQRNTGGWIKNTPMHWILSDEEKKIILADKDKAQGSTIDNGATTMEMVYLSKVYEKTNDPEYKAAFLKGLDYIMNSQYPNGGWPQFYPLRKGYYTHITFNDNAMVSIMQVLKDVAERNSRFSIRVDDPTAEKARKAFERGLECILKCQYRQKGVLTVWCAQHDENTLLPAQARAYELPSLSGAESAGIVKMLMEIKNPSPQIIMAVQSAVRWFDKNRITGIRVETFTGKDGKKDLRVVKDPKAPPLWTRFYDLEDNRPFFCDRDGIKKYSLAEIGYERRNGYSWYGNWAEDVLKDYYLWHIKYAKGQNVLARPDK